MRRDGQEERRRNFWTEMDRRKDECSNGAAWHQASMLPDIPIEKCIPSTLESQPIPPKRVHQSKGQHTYAEKYALDAAEMSSNRSAKAQTTHTAHRLRYDSVHGKSLKQIERVQLPRMASTGKHPGHCQCLSSIRCRRPSKEARSHNQGVCKFSEEASDVSPHEPQELSHSGIFEADRP